MTAAELQAAALEHRRAGLTKLQACDRLRAAGADDDAAAEACFVAYAVPMLALADIRADGLQVRAGMDPATVDHYAEAMQAGERFPPVVTYRDADGVHWLADGHHRVEAARRCGHVAIDADIRTGDRAAALWHAVGANARHGLRPSAADLRNAVTVALQTWPDKSQREIAAQVGCSQAFVSKVRADLITVIRSLPATRTDSIGRQQPTARPKPPAPAPVVETLAPEPVAAVEADPAPVPADDPAPAEDHPMFDAGDFAAILQENADLRRVIESDDHNAELLKINAELRRELEATERQYHGAMTDRNDLIRANKALQRRLRELSP